MCVMKPIFQSMIVLLLLVLGSFPALAQSGDGQDSSGTNPINFTYDFRIYSEFQQFNAQGDNGGGLLTFEYSVPVGEKRGGTHFSDRLLRWLRPIEERSRSNEETTEVCT